MKKHAFYIIGAVVLCFLVINLFPFTAYYILRVIPSNIEYVKRERSNTKIERSLRNDNYNILTKWLQNQLGTIVYESVKIKYIGRKSGTNISMYDISAPFADSIEIYVDSSKQSVINKDLSFIGTKKFQHMYSEWVKKQVGIDDETVELYFNRASCGSRNIGDNAYIDFDKITDLDNLEENICKNTHNLYINSVTLNNFYSVNTDDILKVVNGYEPLLKPYVFTDGDNELRFEVELEDLQNKQNNSYLCSIIFDYNKNSKEESTKEIMGVYISDVENSMNAIRLICTEEQLNQINNHYNIIKELSNAVIPDYYVNCEVNHWLLPEDVIDEEELIKTPKGKYFQDYILRIDKSDVLKNEYVVDILYCDVADDIIAYDYNEKTKKYIPIKTYKAYKNGKRLDMYHNDISSKLLYKGKLRNPMFIRYIISQDNNSFRVIDKTDIYEKDYKGEAFKYYYD